MQIRTVVTLEVAAKDLDARKAFYDEKGEGIGLYFIDSLLSDIESLRLTSGVHSKRFSFHRLLSKRFPFAVYYDLDGSIVRVAAILDMRRDPAWIRQEPKEKKRLIGQLIQLRPSLRDSLPALLQRSPKKESTD